VSYNIIVLVVKQSRISLRTSHACQQCE